jgi:hypothetical protein
MWSFFSTVIGSHIVWVAIGPFAQIMALKFLQKLMEFESPHLTLLCYSFPCFLMAIGLLMSSCCCSGKRSVCVLSFSFESALAP